ncbi:MAG: hypothetical protein OXB84_02585, partial [Halobacteriovoraceae bacterium]|nr:hypothetical protein [Halobacteriovoraceae bacterium]
RNAPERQVSFLENQQVQQALKAMKLVTSTPYTATATDDIPGVYSSIPFDFPGYPKLTPHTSPVDDSPANIFTSFKQMTVEVKNVTETDNDHSRLWGNLSGSLLFTFSVCFRNSSNEKIIKQNFKIEGFEITYPSIPSDDNGCIVWDQPINFNYTQKERHFYFYVHFTGLDRYQGVKTSKIIIQPWEKYAVDATAQNHYLERENPLPLDEANQNIADNANPARVLVEKASVLLEQQGERFQYSITMFPYLFREAINGEKRIEELTSGKFKMNMVIYQKGLTTNKVTRIIDSYSSGIVSVRDHNLTTQVKFDIQSINPHNFLKLAFKLSPVDLPYEGALNPATGVIQLGGGSANGSKTGLSGVTNVHISVLDDNKIIQALQNDSNAQENIPTPRPYFQGPSIAGPGPSLATTKGTGKIPMVPYLGDASANTTATSTAFSPITTTSKEESDKQDDIFIELRPADFRIDRVLFISSFMDPADGDQTKKENRLKTVLLEACLLDNKE